MYLISSTVTHYDFIITWWEKIIIFYVINEKNWYQYWSYYFCDKWKFIIKIDDESILIETYKTCKKYVNNNTNTILFQVYGYYIRLVGYESFYDVQIVLIRL